MEVKTRRVPGREHRLYRASFFIYASGAAIQSDAVMPIITTIQHDITSVACMKNWTQVLICVPKQVRKEEYYVGASRQFVPDVEAFRSNSENLYEVRNEDSGASLLNLLESIKTTRKRQKELGYDYHLIVLVSGDEIHSPEQLKMFYKKLPFWLWKIHVVGVVVPSGDRDREKRAAAFLKAIGARILSLKKLERHPFSMQYRRPVEAW